MSIERFEITVPDAVLEDLEARVRRVRWADEFGNDDWAYGTSGEYLREVVAYWLDGYDWRAHEAAMNRYEHHRAVVQGVPVHFMRVRGSGPDPIPLVLTHGWPWSFWDFQKVIGPLTEPEAHGGDARDAFELVVPSLPGFALSTPLRVPGINWWRTADLWVDLMAELGFERFAASGADWGALVTTQLGHKYSDRLIGLHTSGAMPLDVFAGHRPWSIGDVVSQFARDDAERAAAAAWERRFASHVAVHVLDPYTLAHGLSDSPVGMASWLIERRRAWSDCGGDVERVYSKDDLLTSVMLYWATGAFSSSVRYYAEAARNPWAPAHTNRPMISAPMGISVFQRDRAPGPTDWVRDVYNVHLLRVHESGGHFSAMEVPHVIVTDIRDTFRPLRGV
jgi:pimeloyl-ACP methyl ester carboxylesterase